MLKRPPQHRVDAIPVYVDKEDTAWDEARIKAECAEMREKGLRPSRHPVNVYHSGDSRYDLGAKYDVMGQMRSAADYLGPEATRFVLKRLDHAQLYRVGDIGVQSNSGRLYACAIGLKSIENGPQIDIDPETGVSYEGMAVLVTYGVGLPLKIGAAVIAASLSLKEDEKKP